MGAWKWVSGDCVGYGVKLREVAQSRNLIKGVYVVLCWGGGGGAAWLISERGWRHWLEWGDRGVQEKRERKDRFPFGC